MCFWIVKISYKAQTKQSGLYANIAQTFVLQKVNQRKRLNKKPCNKPY
jgi:hypothetical protein